MIPPIESYRAGLEKALRHSPEPCTFDTVLEKVRTKHAQYWPCGSSVIITQISGTTLHFWLAAGNTAELQHVTPQILDFGREHGCTLATLTGRPGWLRSFLSLTGWKPSRLVMMEKEL